MDAEGDTWIDDHHTNEDIGKQHLWDPLVSCLDSQIAFVFTAVHTEKKHHNLKALVHTLTLLVAGAALAFGTALSKALGDRKGIHRFGNFSAPLDEALVDCVLVGPVLGS